MEYEITKQSLKEKFYELKDIFFETIGIPILLSALFSLLFTLFYFLPQESKSFYYFINDNLPYYQNYNVNIFEYLLYHPFIWLIYIINIISLILIIKVLITGKCFLKILEGKKLKDIFSFNFNLFFFIIPFFIEIIIISFIIYLIGFLLFFSVYTIYYFIKDLLILIENRFDNSCVENNFNSFDKENKITKNIL